MIYIWVEIQLWLEKNNYAHGKVFFEEKRLKKFDWFCHNQGPVSI